MWETINVLGFIIATYVTTSKLGRGNGVSLYEGGNNITKFFTSVFLKEVSSTNDS